jgi:hypothetical protein
MCSRRRVIHTHTHTYLQLFAAQRAQVDIDARVDEQHLTTVGEGFHPRKALHLNV